MDRWETAVDVAANEGSQGTGPTRWEVGLTLSAAVSRWDLLCSERASPLQHAVTVTLAYVHSITPSPAVRDDNGWWSMPGWETRGQIRISLTAEAIAQIREVDGDGYSYELTLDDIELRNKTLRKEKK